MYFVSENIISKPAKTWTPSGSSLAFGILFRIFSIMLLCFLFFEALENGTKVWKLESRENVESGIILCSGVLPLL